MNTCTSGVLEKEVAKLMFLTRVRSGELDSTSVFKEWLSLWLAMWLEPI